MYCELPTVSRCIRRRARKKHVCCECGKAIVPGDAYTCFEGKWGPDWCTFKICLLCAVVRDMALDKYVCHYDDDDGPPFGRLYAWIAEQVNQS